MNGNHPTAFISYSWDDEAHRAWVKDLSSRMRADGVDVTLDQWAVVPGDQLPAYMERGIWESQFVIIVCTPRYKEKSDGRSGGVGYEENIITGAVEATQDERKFIPVLARGEWREAAPRWLVGKAHVDLRGEALPQPRYEDLLVTLHGIRETAPPLGSIPSPRPTRTSRTTRTSTADTEAPKNQPKAPRAENIRIVELVAGEVTQPRNDGTRGSALYAVPFRLSRVPSALWEKAFLQTWDRPPRFTTMHRPGIARIRGDRVVLDGTTVEEVEKYHRDTLVLAVEAANEIEGHIEEERQKQAAQRDAVATEHQTAVEEAAKRIKFT